MTSGGIRSRVSMLTVELPSYLLLISLLLTDAHKHRIQSDDFLKRRD